MLGLGSGLTLTPEENALALTKPKLPERIFKLREMFSLTSCWTLKVQIWLEDKNAAFVVAQWGTWDVTVREELISKLWKSFPTHPRCYHPPALAKFPACLCKLSYLHLHQASVRLGSQSGFSPDLKQAEICALLSFVFNQNRKIGKSQENFFLKKQFFLFFFCFLWINHVHNFSFRICRKIQKYICVK